MMRLQRRVEERFEIECLQAEANIKAINEAIEKLSTIKDDILAEEGKTLTARVTNKINKKYKDDNIIVNYKLDEYNSNKAYISIVINNDYIQYNNGGEFDRIKYADNFYRFPRFEITIDNRRIVGDKTSEDLEEAITMFKDRLERYNNFINNGKNKIDNYIKLISDIKEFNKELSMLEKRLFTFDIYDII